MLAEPEAPQEHAKHYRFDVPVPPPKELIPAHLKHLPVGASCWIEQRHMRALRMHGRKYGWKLVYRAAPGLDGYVAEKLIGKCGRVWRIK